MPQDKVPEFHDEDLAQLREEMRLLRARIDAHALESRPSPPVEQMGFTIEQRSDVWCLVESSGGVRSATPAEVAMWQALSTPRHKNEHR